MLQSSHSSPTAWTLTRRSIIGRVRLRLYLMRCRAPYRLYIDIAGSMSIACVDVPLLKNELAGAVANPTGCVCDPTAMLQLVAMESCEDFDNHAG